MPRSPMPYTITNMSPQSPRSSNVDKDSRLQSTDFKSGEEESETAHSCSEKSKYHNIIIPPSEKWRKIPELKNEFSVDIGMELGKENEKGNHNMISTQFKEIGTRPNGKERAVLGEKSEKSIKDQERSTSFKVDEENGTHNHGDNYEKEEIGAVHGCINSAPNSTPELSDIETQNEITSISSIKDSRTHFLGDAGVSTGELQKLQKYLTVSNWSSNPVQKESYEKAHENSDEVEGFGNPSINQASLSYHPQIDNGAVPGISTTAISITSNSKSNISCFPNHPSPLDIESLCNVSTELNTNDASITSSAKKKMDEINQNDSNVFNLLYNELAVDSRQQSTTINNLTMNNNSFSDSMDSSLHLSDLHQDDYYSSISFASDIGISTSTQSQINSDELDTNMVKIPEPSTFVDIIHGNESLSGSSLDPFQSELTSVTVAPTENVTRDEYSGYDISESDSNKNDKDSVVDHPEDDPQSNQKVRNYDSDDGQKCNSLKRPNMSLHKRVMLNAHFVNKLLDPGRNPAKGSCITTKDDCKSGQIANDLSVNHTSEVSTNKCLSQEEPSLLPLENTDVSKSFENVNSLEPKLKEGEGSNSQLIYSHPRFRFLNARKSANCNTQSSTNCFISNNDSIEPLNESKRVEVSQLSAKNTIAIETLKQPPKESQILQRSQCSMKRTVTKQKASKSRNDQDFANPSDFAALLGTQEKQPLLQSQRENGKTKGIKRKKETGSHHNMGKCRVAQEQTEDKLLDHRKKINPTPSWRDLLRLLDVIEKENQAKKKKVDDLLKKKENLQVILDVKLKKLQSIHSQIKVNRFQFSEAEMKDELDKGEGESRNTKLENKVKRLEKHYVEKHNHLMEVKQMQLNMDLWKAIETCNICSDMGYLSLCKLCLAVSYCSKKCKTHHLEIIHQIK